MAQRISFPVKVTPSMTESDAVEQMMKYIDQLQKIGGLSSVDKDDLVLDYEYDANNSNIVLTLSKEHILDPSKFQTVKAGLVTPVDKIELVDSVKIPNREFSAATISERLRIIGMDPRMRFKLTILDYKKFYKAQSTKLKTKPILAKHLRSMFVTDMMGIFSEILPHIQEGKQLQQLTGLNNVTEGMQTIAKELSLAYKMALKQAKSGQISARNFKNLQTKYNQFMNLLVDQVFPGMGDLLKVAPPTPAPEAGSTEETRTHSEVRGSLQIGTSLPDKFADMFRYIQELTQVGDEVNISIKSLQTGDERNYIVPGGVGMITSISSSTQVSSEILSDGRVSILS